MQFHIKRKGQTLALQTSEFLTCQMKHTGFNQKQIYLKGLMLFRQAKNKHEMPQTISVALFQFLFTRQDNTVTRYWSLKSLSRII